MFDPVEDISPLYLVENILFAIWAVCLFSALVYQLLTENTPPPSDASRKSVCKRLLAKGYAWLWKRAILVCVISLMIMLVDPHTYYGTFLAPLVENLFFTQLNVCICLAIVSFMAHSLLLALVNVIEATGTEKERAMLLPFVSKLEFFFWCMPLIGITGNIIGFTLNVVQGSLRIGVAISCFANAISFSCIFAANIWACKFLLNMLLDNESLSQNNNRMEQQLQMMIKVSMFGAFWLMATNLFQAFEHLLSPVRYDGYFTDGTASQWMWNDRSAGIGSQLLVITIAVYQIWEPRPNSCCPGSDEDIEMV